MNYLIVTDNPEVAVFGEQCGVRRIFVDLETLGKSERPVTPESVVACHRSENISQVQKAIDQADLVVRVNPLHSQTLVEVERCIDAGADHLMLPMFRSARELDQFCRFVAGRVGVIPLIETAGAMNDIDKIVRVEGVAEVFVGLNDLYLELGLQFSLQPLAMGLVDQIAACCREVDMTFGVGSASTVGPGDLPGAMVLGEYVRLGAKWTILSRSFSHPKDDVGDALKNSDLPHEITQLQLECERLAHRAANQVEADHREFCRRVARFIAERA
jgi:2-keto-3-deoxy-L-rhamnonate aldolase RhmA